MAPVPVKRGRPWAPGAPTKALPDLRNDLYDRARRGLKLGVIMGDDNLPRNRQLAGLADCLAIALAASLPWSTSATSILGWIWLVVVLVSLDWVALVETVKRPAGALPLALFLLGLVGMA